MKLSDIMSSMQLSSYAEVAMLLFIVAFVAVAFSLFRNRDGEEWERYRRLPLDGESGAAPSEGPLTP